MIETVAISPDIVGKFEVDDVDGLTRVDSSGRQIRAQQEWKGASVKAFQDSLSFLLVDVLGKRGEGTAEFRIRRQYVTEITNGRGFVAENHRRG